jgi:cell shape-determining protein MreC
MKNYVVSVLIIILSYVGVLKIIQLYFFSISSPVILYFKENAIQTQELLILLSNLDEVRKENLRLKSIISETEVDLLKKRLESLNKNEFEILRDSFANNQGLKNRDTFIKKIIYYDAFSSRVYLDNSQNDNFKIGSLVMHGDSLVGVVSVGNSRVVEVSLISDKSLTINTNIINKDKFKIKTVLDSESGDSLIINNILATEVVGEGDLVVTSNSNENILPDLIIGKIQRIEGISSQTFRKAYITKFYDLNSVNYLGIVKNDK